MTFTPKPGRPSASQAAAISDAILRAATKLFMTQGFDGVSMEAVAGRAGVPKTTLYKRFSDKRALLRAVLEARRASWSEEASRGDAELTENLQERLTHYAKVILTWATSAEVRVCAALAASAWSQPEEAPSRIEVMGLSGMLDLLEHDIREFGPRAGLQPKNPRRVATALMASLAGWLEIRSADRLDAERDASDFAVAAVDLLFRGSAAW